MDAIAQSEIDTAFGHLRALIASKGKLSGCTSYCQRKMQIGYNHASRIMEALEEQQFITAPDKVGIRQPGPAWWAIQEN